jgi:uncharacterized OB-fold protein
MADRYEQFLGSRPGTVVELVDDTASPYLVRTEGGFEFYISAEDFKAYYRGQGTETPSRWRQFITEPETGMVDSQKMSAVMEIVHSVKAVFQDFAKARNFVRDAARLAQSDPKLELQQLRKALEELGWAVNEAPDSALEGVMSCPEEIRALLLSDTCAMGEFVEHPPAFHEEEASAKKSPTKKVAGSTSTRREPSKKASVQNFRSRMKNVEMSVYGDILKITVDLSKEFGPSKSGKTTIVASTEGNKSVPGRDEKVGLNIYKGQDQRPVKGRRSSFKNVEMDVQGSVLTLTVDLSKEFGPSKSGKTIIIASTEGNQLVYNREEKIGLNVYRKIE